MVCVPCFIIPLLLYIWHKFVQPILLRYWNPWEKKDAQGNVIKAGPEFPFECKGGICPYQGAKKQKIENGQGEKEDLVQSTSGSSKESVDTTTTTTPKTNTPTETDRSTGHETKKIK